MNYPALEDIYDLSTDQLKQLQNSLQKSPQNHQELLQTVNLQIQERKTLQFFAKLCETDNPYTKKIADFNDQFIRLAEQVIHKNQSIIPTQNIPTSKNIIQQSNTKQSEIIQNIRTIDKPKQLIEYCIDAKQFTNSKQHRQIQNQSKFTQSDQKSIRSQNITKPDNVSVSTIRSTSKDSQKTSELARSTMKMGIGFNKKKKNKMADIISNTLARTKVDTVVTIKRSGAQSPVKNKYDKKYHIPGQKHQNLEIKKKSPVAPLNKADSQKNRKKIAPETVHKAKQLVSRTKNNTKPSTVKLPKLSPQYDLVAMVKKQQEQRKIRTQKQIQIKKQSNLPKVHTTKNIDQDYILKQKEQDQQIVQDIEGDDKGYRSRESSDTQQEIAEEIQGQVVVIPEEQCQESMSPHKNEKNMQKQDRVVNIQKQNIKYRKQQKQINIELTQNNNNNKQNIDKIEDNKHMSSKQINSQKYYKNQQQYKKQQQQKQQQINNLTNNQANQQNTVKIQNGSQQKQQKQRQTNKDYTKLLIQQIQQQQNKQYYFFNTSPSKNKQQQMQQQSYKSNSIVQNQYNNIDNQQKQIQTNNNKIYSEEYWAHIREEAQLKIKRFRQQKEIQQLMEFANINNNNNMNMNNKQSKNNTISTKNNTKQQQQETQQQQTQQKIIQTKYNKQIQKKKAELQKMKKKIMNNKNITTKKNVKPLIPRVIHPKPQFNYLQIYPTFNHIFCTMYLKPTHQANSQIPNLLRQLKILFANHVQHFQQNKTTFQPAIFLPFDNNGAFHLRDPKQLLVHAQNTYVDLKTMVHRIQNFNKSIKGNFDEEQQQNQDKRYFRVVKSKQQVYDIITTSFMRTNGWKQLPHGSGLRATWNLFWSWSKPDIDMNKLLIWQKINHFPFNKNLSRKDLLYKNLQHFKKVYRVSMNFLPLTFNLPKQFSQLSMKFHEEQMLNKDSNYWIMKPIGKSRGRGIKVISSLSELNYIDNIVVQKYISNPLLLDGYKFDMRIYVLVTHFHPLQAFVYKEGFARLSTEKYSMDVNSIKNAFIHLTNFSINKNNLDAKSNFVGGSKISLKTLKDRLTKMGYSYPDIWKQVHEIIIKSLLGCSISVPNFPGAFQLYGYDVMLDTDGQCHLIQINSSPSLERSFIIDEIIKQNMIDDLLQIVNPPQFDKKELLNVLVERIQMLTDNKKITPEDDLLGIARILKYKPIRKIGQKPDKLGLFEVVAPSQTSNDLQKLIKGRSGANNPQNID